MDNNNKLDKAKITYVEALQGILLKKMTPPPTPIWEYDDLFINPNTPPIPKQCYCSMGERKAIPKEGIITFSAKQKQGKSLSTYALSIPLLSGQPFDTITPSDKPNMIIAFDMEMGANTLHNRLQAQLKAIGSMEAPFYIVNLKPIPLPQRLKLIKEKIDKYNPAIVIIDQAAKLIPNGNDLEESNHLVNTLDAWSTKRSIWVVMHENKSKEDENMKGHLGSFLSYAAVEAYAVSKKDGVFTITPREARETETDGAAAVRFTLNQEGIIKAFGDMSAEEAEERRQREFNAFASMFALVYQDVDLLSYTELVNKTRETHRLSRDAAKTAIAGATAAGVIRKDGEEHRAPYKYIPYRTPTDNPLDSL